MVYQTLNDVGNAISSGVWTILLGQGIIAVLAVLGVYLHARLKKAGELKEINNNFKTLLEQQKDLTEETGRIKQQLDQEATLFRVRLEAYRQKSIDAIETIYSELIVLREAAQQVGMDPGKDARNEFIRKVAKFRKTFELVRIWLPSHLAEHVEGVAVELDNRTHRFITVVKQLENLQNLKAEKIEELSDKQSEYYDYIHQEIVKVFEELVEKIASEVQVDA